MAGTFVRDIETAKQYINMGFDFIAYGADSLALKSYYENIVNKINSNITHG